jgi:hypothetical protein
LDDARDKREPANREIAISYRAYDPVKDKLKMIIVCLSNMFVSSAILAPPLLAEDLKNFSEQLRKG